MASKYPPRRTATRKSLRKLAGLCDHGTPERWQHSGRTMEMTDRAGILAARVTEEHILDILGLKNLLDMTQIEAGLKFKADYHAAAIAARVSASYSCTTARDFFRAEHERNEAEEAAYRRWRAAVKELGLNASTAVIETVCHDTPPHPRDLRPLQEGLRKLALWYKLPTQAPAKETVH